MENINRQINRNFIRNTGNEHNYVIKPIQVELTEEVDKLSKNILIEPKFRVCLGSPHSGKTALVYKLMLSLIKQEPDKVNLLFCGLDGLRVYDYWNEKISKSDIDDKILESFKNIPFIYPFALSLIQNHQKSIQFLIEDNIVKSNYNILIVDGFDRCFERNGICNGEIKKFLEYLSGLVEKNGISVFITSQKYYRYLKTIPLFGKAEKWKLDRPSYLGGAIGEYGETRLTIK